LEIVINPAHNTTEGVGKQHHKLLFDLEINTN